METDLGSERTRKDLKAVRGRDPVDPRSPGAGERPCAEQQVRE